MDFAFIEDKQVDRMNEFVKHLVLPVMHFCKKKKEEK